MITKYLVSAGVGALALAASAIPSAAATVDCTLTAGVCDLGSISDPAGPGPQFVEVKFSDDVTGNFSQQYSFNLQDGSDFQRTSITYSNPFLNLFTLNLTGGTTNQTTACTPGTFSCALTFPAGIQAGLYVLTVVGSYLVPGQTAAVAGTATFGFFGPDGGNNPVPLPGALVLMGTVLMGGAGLAKWRKSASRLGA